MKKTSFKYLGATLAVGLGLSLGALQAQSVTTTTREVTSEGTISSFEPKAFVVRSESAPGPLTYTYGPATRYVDDSGAAVTREVIRPGVPVTVYYTRDGDSMVASRVIVHRAAVAAPAPAAETRTTRTTTTTVDEPPLTRHEAREEAKHERKREKEALEHPERESRREAEREVVRPQPQVTTETTTTETTSPQGVVRSFAPDQFVVNGDAGPVTYRYSKSTEYVDEAGSPVTVDVVRSGVPVTVRYIREGDGLVARRVIVHRGPRPVPGPGPGAVRRLPPP